MASKVESRSVNIYINGKQATSTLKEMESHSRKLRNELSRLVPGTEAFKNKMAELKSVNRQLQDIRDDIRGLGGAFGWLKTEIGKFGVLAAGYLGFEFISNKFRDIISQNALLSDSIADVMKTTGLSETAVRRLNSEFKQIDTRSSREELNGLARVAGKLGISAEQDVLAFVKAADQINVALGEDLGGAEEAINSLGKLVDIFKLKDEYGLEQALLNVGSAINELGAAGTANEGFLVEFTKRLGGVAPAANISIQDILGLAATMDELGQPVEASATAIGQFIVSLGKDIPKFAKVAGMSVRDFSALLQQDGNAALVAVLKNLQSTNGGIATLAQNMGFVGEEGARAVTALGVLSNNLGLLQTRQKLANDEFESGLSLTEEFTVKNNTFGAELDKLGKKIGSLTSNFTFQDFLLKLTLAFSAGVDWIIKNAEAIGRWIKILAVAGSAVTTYRAYLLLANTAMFQYITLMLAGEKAAVLSRTSTIALAGAKALLSGNLTKAAQAWRLLNVTMTANPIGAVLAGIVAITTALVLFNSKLGVAAQSAKDFNDIRDSATKKVSQETDTLVRLNKIRTDENSALSDKIRAVQRIRDLYPDILEGLTNEEALTNKGTAAINKYIQALDRKTTAEAAQAKITELKKRNMDLDASDGSEGSWLNEGFQAIYGALGLDSQVKRLRGYNKQANSKEKRDNNARIKEIESAYGEKIKQDLLNGDTGTGTGPGFDDPTKTNPEDTYLKNLLDKMADAQQKALADRLEKVEAEKQAIRNKYAQELREAEQNIKDHARLSAAKLAIKKAEEAEMTTYNEKRKREEGELIENLLKQANEEFDAFMADRAAAQEEIFQALMTDQQREQLAVDQHFEKLLAMADQYGFDTAELFKKWAEAKTEVTKKHDEGDQKKVEETEAAKKTLMLDTARDVSDGIFSIINNRRQAELDATIRGLDDQRNRELANENLTEAQRAAINKRYDDQIRAEKRKAWIAEQKSALAQALINGALAVTKVLAQTGVAAPFVIPSIIAGTLAQVAVIAAQKPPQFEHGGYSAVDYDDPKGFVRRPTLFAKSASGRPFIAGEKYKTEYIISSEQLKDPVIADFVGMMESRRGVAQFERGGYSGHASAGGSSAPGAGATYNEMVKLLQQILDAQMSWNDKEVVFSNKVFERDQQRRALAFKNQSA